MEWLLYIFLAGLGVIAYMDWKTKHIPDIITSALWLCFIIAGAPDVVRTCAYAFGMLFGINNLFIWLISPLYLKWIGDKTRDHTEAFAWGDIILLPLFFAVVPNGIIVFACSIFLATLFGLMTKVNEVPYTPFLLAATLLELLL